MLRNPRRQEIDGPFFLVETPKYVDSYVHRVDAIRAILSDTINENFAREACEQLNFYFLESIKNLEEANSLLVWLKNKTSDK